MKPEQFEVVAEASQMFIRLASFTKHNPAIKTPDAEMEYSAMAEALMELLRNK